MANHPFHLTRRHHGFSEFNVSPAAAQVNGTFAGFGSRCFPQAEMVMTPDDAFDGAIREGDPPFGGRRTAEVPPRPKRLCAGFWLLLVLNVIAAYLPGLFWVHDLPGSGSSALIYLYSPIAFSLLFLIGTTSLIPPTIFLGAFLCAIAALSFLLQRSRIAKVVMPVALFFLCLAQGLMFAAALRGIDAIGHS